MAQRIQIGGGKREQVKDLDAAPRITPRAAPVDTYYRPAESQVRKPDESGIADLAKALDGLKAPVNQLLEQRSKEERDNEIAAGAEALRRNREKFAEAIKTGQIPHGMSPWAYKGLLQAEGRLAANDFSSAAHQAMQEGGLYESDNATDIPAFLQKFREEWSKDKPQHPDWIASFAPQSDAAMQNLTSHHLQVRSAEVTAKTKDALYKETSVAAGAATADLAGAFEDGDKIVSLQNAGAVMTSRVKEYVANGLPGRLANETVVDSIVATAREGRNMAILGVLDHIQTGSGKLGGTSYAKDQRLRAETYIREWDWNEQQKSWSIESQEWTRDSRAYELKNRDYVEEQRTLAKEERDTKKLAQWTLSSIVLDVLKDHAKPLDAKKLGELAKLDPRDVAFAHEFQRSLLNQAKNPIDEDATVNALVSQMVNEPGSFDVRSVFKAHTTGNLSTNRMLQLLNEWQGIDKAERTDPLMKDPILKGVIEGLKRGVETNMENARTGAGYVLGDRAVREMRSWIISERETNPKQSRNEFMKKLDEEQARLFKKYNDIGASFLPGGNAPGGTKPTAPKDTKPVPLPMSQRPAVDQGLGIGMRMIPGGSLIADKILPPATVPSGILKALDAARKANDQQAINDILKDYPALKGSQ